MFSTGQMVFALLFVLAFIAVMIAVYRRDKKWQKQQYKGVGWVLAAFIGFIAILLFLKYILKN